MRIRAALALALAGTALAGCSHGAETADSASAGATQTAVVAVSQTPSPTPSPVVSPTPTPSPTVSDTPSPTPSTVPSGTSTSPKPASAGRYDAATIVRHLDAQDAGGGRYLYMTPDGFQCEISAVLTSRPEVSKAQAAGGDVATTADGSAGVSITADDVEPCRQALSDL